MIIVKNRELLIPDEERYIGTNYDTSSENRQFRVSRFAQNGVDLSALTFRLDLKYENASVDTLILDKETTDDYLVLTWEITKQQVQAPGTLWIQIRAVDSEATVRWSSYVGAMYVDRHLYTPKAYTGDLTEIEQIEQDHQYMLHVVDELREDVELIDDVRDVLEDVKSYKDQLDAASEDIISLQNHTGYITPDDFQQYITDEERIAAAINSLEDGGTVCLQRTYNLTGNVILNRLSWRKKVTVLGLSPSCTIKCNGYGFVGTNQGNDGNITFSNVVFEGTGNLIDAYYLVRIYFENCQISGFNSVVYNSKTGQERVYIQSVYFVNCCIRQIKNYIILLHDDSSAIDYIIDVKFDRCNLEWCESGIALGNYYDGFVFTNNAVEGFSGGKTLIKKIITANLFVFRDNYLEKNGATCIDMSVTTAETINADISCNLFTEDVAEYINFLIMPKVNTGGDIKITKNEVKTKANSGSNFIYVYDDVAVALPAVTVEGNAVSSALLNLKHDVNNRIQITQTLARWNDANDVVDKVNTLPDQRSGKTYSCVIPIVAVALSNSVVSIPVSTPFIIDGTPTITLTSVNLVDVGNIASQCALYGAIRPGGFELRSSGSSVTAGKVYTGYVNVKFTY